MNWIEKNTLGSKRIVKTQTRLCCLEFPRGLFRSRNLCLRQSAFPLFFRTFRVFRVFRGEYFPLAYIRVIRGQIPLFNFPSLTFSAVSLAKRVVKI